MISAGVMINPKYVFPSLVMEDEHAEEDFGESSF